MDPDRQIRVLYLLPGAFHDEIRCALHVQWIDCDFDKEQADVENRPRPQLPYDALSYAWGDQEDPKFIWFYDDGELPVTENLWNALRRLRDSTYTRRLWVDDQLCIDQTCKYEQSHQIAHMDLIYSHAGNVIIWLGDATCDDNEPPKSSHRKYKQLEEAIMNTQPLWWTRAWVVQEFALARHERIFRFGTSVFRYIELELFFYGQFAARVLTLRPFRAFDITAHFSAFEAIAWTENIHALIFRVWILVLTDCSSPKDKVYSLLTLMSAEERAFVKPDYSKSIEEIYAEATHAWIAANKSLSILVLVHAAGLSSESSCLPSWCVDFQAPRKDKMRLAPLRRTRHDWHESRHTIPNDDFELGEEQTTPWCHRQADLKARVAFDANHLTLTVTALRFDRIALAFDVDCESKVTSWFQETASPEKSWSLYTAAERRIHETIMQRIADGDPYPRLIARDTSPGTADTNDEKIKLGMISRYLRAWDDAHKKETHRLSTFSIARCAAAMFHGATLFMTQAGFLGLGPIGIHVNDQIVLPYGSRHPMALEEDDEGTWEFKGLTYVHGIMEGEILEALPNVKFEERDFILK